MIRLWSPSRQGVVRSITRSDHCRCVSTPKCARLFSILESKRVSSKKDKMCYQLSQNKDVRSDSRYHAIPFGVPSSNHKQFIKYKQGTECDFIYMNAIAPGIFRICMTEAILQRAEAIVARSTPRGRIANPVSLPRLSSFWPLRVPVISPARSSLLMEEDRHSKRECKVLPERSYVKSCFASSNRKRFKSVSNAPNVTSCELYRAWYV